MHIIVKIKRSTYSQSYTNSLPHNLSPTQPRSHTTSPPRQVPHSLPRCTTPTTAPSLATVKRPKLATNCSSLESSVAPNVAKSRNDVAEAGSKHTPHGNMTNVEQSETELCLSTTPKRRKWSAASNPQSPPLSSFESSCHTPLRIPPLHHREDLLSYSKWNGSTDDTNTLLSRSFSQSSKKKETQNSNFQTFK